jgi:hypothetical protein
VSDEGLSGVVFPVSNDGTRSTSALGRAVVADALRAVDPVGAASVEREASWRSGYLDHFRRLVEAGLLSADAARTIATDGLASLHARMRFIDPQGEETSLDGAWKSAARRPLRIEPVGGAGAANREVSIPVRGAELAGSELDRQLDGWADRGIVEPSVGEAVRAVRDNPEWLDLSDCTFVVLGAASEMGPLPALLRWGASVVAVDLPRPQLWARVLETAHTSAGRLLVPVAATGSPTGSAAGSPTSSPTGNLAERAGADLLTELPAVAALLGEVTGPLVVGNYVYADGATNLRLSVAVDALLTQLVRERGSDVALAGLATPTDVFVVPRDAVEHSVRAYTRRSAGGKLLGRPMRLLSGGRLLQRNYTPDADPGVTDSLVPQQGPNYALAKRVHRWRATVARAEGQPVSFNVAPPTRTRSVVKNRALAAAYAGAHRFGVEVFEPETSRALMALLLVHDLRACRPAEPHPWQDEAFAAAHGGLWRTARGGRGDRGTAGRRPPRRRRRGPSGTTARRGPGAADGRPPRR